MNERFYIGERLIQPFEGLISHDGKLHRIEPKIMAVLVVLAKEEGNIVSRDTLMDRVWPNQDITDDVLTNAISTLRRYLGDDRHKIETIPKRGYRLLASENDENNSVTEQKNTLKTAHSLFNNPVTYWLLVLFMGIAAVVWFNFPTPSMQKIDDRSIAVLPFDVFSSNPEMKHFSSGLEEELIHQLSAHPGLKVIARTSSSVFKQQNKNIREISDILGVRHVVEGSVRDDTSGIRITVQLIDAQTDHHLWSRVFDVERTKLIQVQEQIATAVSELMLPENEPQPPTGTQRHPVPDEAYRLFLLGQSHLRVGTVESYQTAASHFSNAIRISPHYALAYTRLAVAYLMQYQYQHVPMKDTAPRVLAVLDKALEIDKFQPEAIATMALLKTYQKDFDAAESLFLEALGLQKNLRFALHNYGFMLWSESRSEEALAYLNRALTIDPLSGVTNFLVGDVLASTGRLKQAGQHYEHCQKVLPEYYSCFAGMASLQLLMGDFPAASQSFSRAANLVPEGNLWQDIGMTNLAISKAEWDKAVSLIDRASAKNPLNYNVLRSQLIINLKSGQLLEFIETLIELQQANPQDRDLNLITGLAFYMKNDCSSAVKYYAREQGNAESFLVDVWDLEFGLSHGISLAYCYQLLERREDSDRVLLLLESYLDKTPEMLFDGHLWLQAASHAVSGNRLASEQVLAELQKSNWPFIWLAEIQPVFQHK